MTHVVIAVPAHDEAAEIGGCLRSVLAAGRAAVRSGRCRSFAVGVALHRCTDDSEDVARDALAEVHDAVIHHDQHSGTVGEVRAGLVAALTARDRCRVAAPDDVWVFNTDADSRVPRDWIGHTLDLARRSDAAAVAGMVALRGWVAPAEALVRYRAILDAGVHGDSHEHVYGANLAVRLDAYRAVGGFRAGNGEDQDLVDRLRRASVPLLTTFEPLVETSAREPGRAVGGLGALLQRLREDEGQVTLSPRRRG